MTKYSLTIAGVLVSVGGSLLVQWGFSEACTNEILTLLPVLVGGVMSYWGKLRNGGVDVFGRKI